MPKVRALVPLTDPKTGDAIAAGAEIDVDDEAAANWRADGKASMLADEQKAAESPGVYDARTSRPEAPPPAEDKGKKGKNS